MDSSLPLIGSVFAQRYHVVRLLASGGMGSVYEVTHLPTNRRRALKVMHPRCLQNEVLCERFRMEARVAASIESECIVDVLDAGVDAATQMPFLVMELLRGEDLGQVLRRKGRLSPAEALSYLRQIAAVLDATHRADVVHRDLKPENLFLTARADGSPWIKVLDFGIAKVIAESSNDLEGTRGVGTPLYMAPEQFQSDSAITPATDLYALGLVTYTLLAGAPYWREESRRSEGNMFAFAREVMKGPVEPATARARRAGVELPEAFATWFSRATAVSPAQRFPTAGKMVLDLATALRLAPVPPSSTEAPETMPLSQSTDASRSRPGTMGTMGPLEATNPPSSRQGRRVILGLGAAVSVTALGATGVALLGGRTALSPTDAAVTPPASASASSQGRETSMDGGTRPAASDRPPVAQNAAPSTCAAAARHAASTEQRTRSAPTGPPSIKTPKPAPVDGPHAEITKDQALSPSELNSDPIVHTRD